MVTPWHLRMNSRIFVVTPQTRQPVAVISDTDVVAVAISWHGDLVRGDIRPPNLSALARFSPCCADLPLVCDRPLEDQIGKGKQPAPCKALHKKK